MRKWIAHRGNNNHGYQENTCESLLTALKTDYIAGVELDVRKTKDNQLVIIHNPTISQTSNGFGIVKYMTLKELKQYNFGNRTHPSKICTLNDFLKEIHTNKIILIEVKDNEIEQLLYETIEKYPKLNIYICSFDYKFVISFQKKYPKYPVGLIMGDMINHNKNTESLDFISTKDIFLKEKKPLFFWGIDSIELIKKTNENAIIVTDKAYFFKDVFK